MGYAFSQSGEFANSISPLTAPLKRPQWRHQIGHGELSEAMAKTAAAERRRTLKRSEVKQVTPAGQERLRLKQRLTIAQHATLDHAAKDKAFDANLMRILDQRVTRRRGWRLLDLSVSDAPEETTTETAASEASEIAITTVP